MLTGETAVCSTCHKADSKGGKAAVEIADLLDTLAKGGDDSKDALARARKWRCIPLMSRRSNERLRGNNLMGAQSRFRGR